MDIELPNGKILQGVPFGTSKTEIMRKAVNAGDARYEDFFPAGDPTEGMSGFDKFRAGMGKSFVDTARGVAQIFDDGKSHEVSDLIAQRPSELQARIDEAKRLDAPLLKTGAGFAGNITGTVAQTIPLLAVPGANTVAGSMALGALQGGLQPTASDESTAGNIIAGGVLGATGQVVGNLAPRVIGSLVSPFMEGGRQKLVADALRRFATDPDAISRAATSNVPGVNLTLAQATQDPGLSILERSIAAGEPQVMGSLAKRQAQNLAATRDALGNIAGDEASRAAAEAARRQASNPLYTAARSSTASADTTRVVNLIDRMVSANPANKALTGPLNAIRESLFESYPAAARGSDAWKALTESIAPSRYSNIVGSQEIKAARTVMDRVRKGTIDADEALEQLKSIKFDARTPQRLLDAFDLAKRHMKTPDFVLMEKPGQLMSAMDNIKAMLGNADNAFVKKELTTIKDALGHQINKVAPEFGQAEEAFAQGSRPINQMDVGTKLYNTMVPALQDTPGIVPTASKSNLFAEALRNGDQTAKKATGFKGATLENVMDPAQMDTLRGIQDFLARKQAAEKLGLGVGSNTAQNLAGMNVVRQVAGPLGVPASWMGDVFSQSLARPWTLGAAPVETAIQQRLAQALLNPQEAARMLQAATPSQQQALIQSLYQKALTTGSIASGAEAAGQ
jgi:hypothetical protein